MLDILKKRLPNGLEILSVKELNSKYKIVFKLENNTASAELKKTCAPNCHNKNADDTIITAMSAIYLNRGDLLKAKEWLDKL